MKAQIALFRAKKIDSDEYVDGWLLWNKYIITSKEKFDFGSGNPDCDLYEIDPSTLAISFDGGESWFSIEAVKHILESSEVTGIQE